MIGAEAVLGIGLALSSAADIHTTRSALKNCASCYEANSLMRPFAGSGPRMVLAMTGLNTANFMASRELRHLRKRYWWMPLAAGISLHTFAAVQNARRQ